MESTQICVRVPVELKSTLEQEAKKEGRTLSNMVLKILTDHVRNNKK